MTSARTSLATRITLACLAVAVLAATVAALSSARLVATTTRDAARTSLATQADALAVVLADVDAAGLRAAAASLAADTRAARPVQLVVVTPAGMDGPALARAAAQRAGVDPASPADASDLVRVDQRTWLVEARTLPAGAVVLVEEHDAAWRTGLPLTRSVLVASAIGLVGAAVAGSLLAGVVSRPLRRVAGTARTMRDGRRDLRAPVEGPREVADVALSVNQLAESLERSELRQRRFLMSVSHELRTPLTAVRGFAESIADGVTTGAEAERAARTILAESARLEHLVTDLLDLARLGADDFRLDRAEVDLDELLTQAAQVWTARARTRGVDVVVVGSPGLSVVTDGRRVRQVLDGLAENALRVTPAGRPLVLAIAPSGDGAAIEVRDGGPGLDPDDYAVAFERGVLHERHGPDRGGSSGIGLSLIDALVRRLGGRVSVGPAAEGGAAFRVDLPGRAPDQAPRPSQIR